MFLTFKNSQQLNRSLEVTNTIEPITLTFVLLLFTHCSIRFNRDEYFRWRQCVFSNRFSFCLKQIIQWSSWYVSSMSLLTSSIEEYNTVLMSSDCKNETKNLFLKSLRICSYLYVNLIEILVYGTPSKPPRKHKVRWWNNLRVRFEDAGINKHPSQLTGTYNIFMSAVMLVEIRKGIPVATVAFSIYQFAY